MLLSIFPFAFVLSAVRPVEDAMALLLIVHVLTFVFTTIGPLECALAFHFVVDPRADEYAAI